MRLDGRVAIVTGAANGIGREITRKLAKEGANVVVGDIILEQANKVVDEIKALGVGAIAVKVDVSKRQEAYQMAKATLDEFGKIDILVNNAGAGKEAPFYQSTEEVLDWVIGVSLKGVLNCTQAVIEHMMQRRSGKIVSIASVAGVIGVKDLVSYSAAKAGVIGFTRALAKELGPYGINVNCVSPGPIETEGTSGAMRKSYERALKTVYVGRIGKPDDIANVVLLLASDEGSFITGQNYIVCGGRSLGF